jgi:hypothetical protein
MKKSLTDYFNSNLFKAVDLDPDPNVRIEANIVSVRDRDFEDGTTKPIAYTDYLGKGVVLNATRLKAVIAAWGTNPDNLIGKTVLIYRGSTLYQGNKVPCVEVEPVVADRIAAEQKWPALDHAPIDIRSGKRAWDNGLPEPTPPTLDHDGGPDNGPEEQIPF